MKTYLRKVILFSVCVFVMLVGLNYFQGFYNNDLVHYSLQYDAAAKKGVAYEGIIIGSSEETHAIRPSVINKAGVQFYNFALNGAGAEFYKKWYNDFFLVNHPKPRYCIVGVSWFMFSDWLDRKFEHDSEYLPFDLFCDYLGRDDYESKLLIENRMPVFKYRESFLSSLMLERGDERYVRSEYDDGFIEYRTPYNPDNFRTHSTKKESSPVAKEEFRRLVEQLVSEGVKLIFLMSPEYGIEEKEYESSDALAYVKTLSDKYGIPFLNYNTMYRSQLNDDVTNFSDWDHLDGLGSMKFSVLLEEELRNVFSEQKNWVAGR